MQFGLSISFEDWSHLRDLGQTAEELGFDSLFFPDHLLFEGAERDGKPRHPALDPIIQAAVVADATRRLRIGHLVLCNPFRHPGVTARSLASLDQLSGGRLIAGLGAGWEETEFRMHGIAFPDVATRLRMLDEALSCIRGLWRGEPFSYAGEFYQLRDALLLPRPVQEPHPPFLLGGGGRGLLRLAARYADVVNIVLETGRDGYVSLKRMAELSDTSFREKVSFLRAEARRHGRDGGKIAVGHMVSSTIVADSPAAARAAAEQAAGRMRLSVEAIRRSPAFLIGTPEECVSELRRREAEWESSQVIFTLSGMGGEPGLRRLAAEILAHV